MWSQPYCTKVIKHVIKIITSVLECICTLFQEGSHSSTLLVPQ